MKKDIYSRLLRVVRKFFHDDPRNWVGTNEEGEYYEVVCSRDENSIIREAKKAGIRGGEIDYRGEYCVLSWPKYPAMSRTRAVWE